jgi:uncharacterized protein YdhG (YjbR/CyaY superfamily)
MSASDVDTFLAKLPEGPRASLERLRQSIRSIVPEAEEGISYGVPGFKYRGRPLVSYGLSKKHCSFYVQSLPVMDAHKAALAGYDKAGGTVHFQPDAPLPDDLVRTLVQARMAETDAAAKRK